MAFCGRGGPHPGADVVVTNHLDPQLGLVLFGQLVAEVALDELAADCAADKQYTFLYTAAPLKVVRGTGAPVNPIVVK